MSKYKTKHDVQWTSIRPVTITPESAKKLMDNYYEAIKTDPKKRNRPVNHKAVATYAADMASGKWKLNSAVIAFDTDGIVFDGQHRLLACIKSGCTIASTITYNVDRDAFDTVDTGSVRTATQTIGMLGAKYSSNISAIISGLRGFMTSMPPGGIYASKSRFSPREIREVYESDQAGYDEAAEFAARYYRTKMLSQKLLGVLYYYLIHEKGQDRDTVRDFLIHITLDDTVENNIENTLRKKLFALARGDSHSYDRIRLAFIARAWNALAAGQTKIKLPSCDSIATMDFNQEVPQFESRV